MTPDQQKHWQEWFDHLEIRLATLTTLCAMHFAKERAMHRLMHEMTETAWQARYRQLLAEEEEAMNTELVSAIESAKAEARKWNLPPDLSGEN